MKVTLGEPISDKPASHERRMVRTYEVRMEVSDDEGAALGETFGEIVMVEVIYYHYDDTNDNYYKLSDIKIEGYQSYSKVREAIIMKIIETLREEGFRLHP
jgi:hypothetical protein